MSFPSGLYTIPSHQPFLKRLAEGLLESVGGQLDQLAQIRVMLPTRRAARGLRDIFPILIDKPALLPRLQPIGDVDADELDLTLAGYGLDLEPIPPAIPKLERQFLLAELISAKEKSLGFDQCLSLAGDLAVLIDQVHTESLDFSNLAKLVPQSDSLSAHWKETLEFLEIITAVWPSILKERGQIDASERRVRLMDTLVNLWSLHPPQTPVIAAGSTGSIPATARLLGAISKLPQGAVILPGLDLGLPETDWALLGDTHPQRTMRNFLTGLEKTRADVKLWPNGKSDKASSRTKWIRAMMAPAETYGSYRLGDEELNDYRASISICEAANPREHAALIATTIREALEDDTATIGLITPDRNIAERVIINLKRWNIDVDDSAGIPLARTASGSLILSLVRSIAEEFAPLPLIEILKHPFTALGTDEEIYSLEEWVLRGAKPEAGWKGLRNKIDELAPEKQTAVLPCFENARTALQSLEQLSARMVNPAQALEVVVSVYESLCGGAEAAWEHEESDALSTALQNLLRELSRYNQMEFDAWSGILRDYLVQETYRKTESKHPRIVILGQLEARLLRYDVMILAGLNEGMWPAEPSHDPWMSRPMRKTFGLPPSDRSIGLSAHDFSEALHANRVLITRSLREDGADTVPSRWLQRLRTLLDAANEKSNWGDTQLLHWTRLLDQSTSKYKRTEAPEPRPPQDARPLKLPATAIEKWINNPYEIYARRILNLRRIPSIEEDLIHAEKGTFLHAVLEEFVKTTANLKPDIKEFETILTRIAKRRLAERTHMTPEWRYWKPQIARVASDIAKTEYKLRTEDGHIPWKQEAEGQMMVYESAQSGRQFIVTAKADRIDRCGPDGSAIIIDYKTGTFPSNPKVLSGQAPQLPIEAYILKNGGYGEGIDSIAGLCYWKVPGEDSIKNVLNARSKPSIDGILEDTHEGLTRLFQTFEDPATPYTAFPRAGELYEDEKAYAHLARMAEWAVIDINSDNTDDNEESE